MVLAAAEEKDGVALKKKEKKEKKEKKKGKEEKEEEEEENKGNIQRETRRGARSAGRTTSTTTTTLARASPSTGDGNEEDVDPEASEVLYIGHLPHGFYEKELRSFFSQFGDVKHVKVSRSKKSARSKGYAFVGFESAAIAAIACRALNGYVMFGQVLKCNIVRRADVHTDLFKGCDKKFRTIPWQTIAVEKHDKPLTEAEATRRQERLLRSERKRRRKIADAGIDYEFDGYAEAQARKAKESATASEKDEKTQKKKKTEKKKRADDDDDVREKKTTRKEKGKAQRR